MLKFRFAAIGIVHAGVYQFAATLLIRNDAEPTADRYILGHSRSSF